MITSIGHAAVWVSDMEKSLHFYCDILGCRKAFSSEYMGRPGTEYLAVANGALIELFYGGIKHALPPKSEEHPAGFSHFCLNVDDLHKTVAEIKARGGVLSVEPKRGMNGNWQAWITDPDGVEIELMELELEYIKKVTLF